MDAVTTAQTATAVGTVVLAVATIILAVATVILARGTARQAEVSRQVVQENRELVRANREMVEEMRQTRIAQDRPHILVDIDFTYAPAFDIVIQNIGRGPAKNVKFDPLPDLLNSRGKNISDFAYFKDGLDFLAPGAEVRTFWDMSFKLIPSLDQRGNTKGFAITANYESVAGETCSSPWTLNPLLFRER